MGRRRFKPGEVLVLINDRGGRLFTVHHDTSDGPVERRTFASQQQYAQPTRRHQLIRPARRHQLIRPASAQKAEELVERLRAVAAERDRKIQQVRDEADQMFRTLYREYEQETDLETADRD